ncbi:MAG: L,D-transpeptidase [Notoacmeibacter sp.]|nr:L,D-transpeptidase [Notoacmeibacter sp.]MCC0032374.1 L,D-transpeptidase [Brucellaceae bacterium]
MNFKTFAAAATIALTTALAGCSGTAIQTYSSSYGIVKDSGYQLPRIPISRVPQRYHRQMVRYDTKEKAGTVIVDTREKFLYLVMSEGKAMRYGIGVGRKGFEWSGTARIGMKREWPVWTPPSEMIGRDPKLAKYREGMEPGLRNPLGARAMYLFNKSGDTGYRLHGSPEWNSIGGNVSSGCIRLMNQDVIDLYNRVSVGAKVIVQ